MIDPNGIEKPGITEALRNGFGWFGFISAILWGLLFYVVYLIQDHA